jgi:hypothetical protein
MPDQPDNAIDKVLAALRDAPPPEGMDARIAQRLDQHAQHTQTRPTSHWRALLTGQSLAAAWFRGAATGAVAALLTVAAVFAFHHASTPAPQQAAMSPNRNPAITPVSVSPRNTTPYPCAHPAAFKLATAAKPHAAEIPWTVDIAENTAPSRPAPVMPLTAQERQLVRLVRASNPNELAAISHETHAKQQDAAEDSKFFIPPPSSSESPAEAKPEPDTVTTPESTPEATPEADQPSPEATSDATSPANQ